MFSKVIENKLKDNKGFSTILVILLLTALIPLIFFVTIDLPHFMQMNRKVKNVLDNSASAGITQINEDKLQNEGVLEVDIDKANKLAKDVFVSGFKLNEDLTTNSESLIYSTPKFEVGVAVASKDNIKDIATPSGTYKLEHPSVIANTEVEVRGKIFKMIKIDITKTSISQVKLRE